MTSAFSIGFLLEQEDEERLQKSAVYFLVGSRYGILYRQATGQRLAGSLLESVPPD
jgi:hypothetical protein